MWRAFFDELGAEVVVSPPTTKAMLAAGSAAVVAETCLPTKVFCGHVIQMASAVDFLFIPSIRSIELQVYNCSKFLGLPDLIRATVPDCPPVIDIELDVNKGAKRVNQEIGLLGRYFTRNPFKIKRAWAAALQAEQEYRAVMTRGLTPPEAIANLLGEKERGEAAEGPVHQPLCDPEDADITVAVIGHPYNIYDRHVNHALVDRLRRLGVRVVAAETAPSGALDAGTARLVGRPYWTFEDEVVGAAGHYLYSEVDGVVCVVCFGCGPDSLMLDVIQRAAKARGTVPLVTLTIDEHTGEAGLVTRLEAFTDMVRRRRRQRLLLRP
jgi:predicted nucleotide-binding protein (sugar kinase/HSP70/actin superfamily)